MKRNFLRPLFVAALLAIAISVRAAIPPAENLLPSDTLLVVTVPDSAAFRSELHQSPHWMLWNDPAMKPFHDKFISNCKEQFITPLERDLGIKLSDFSDLPQGQFTFAVTANGWNGSDDNTSPGTILLIDAKDKSGLLKTNIATLQKKWTADNKSIRTEKIGGIPFSVVTLASNDIPSVLQNMIPKRPRTQELGKEEKPAKPGELVVGQYQSLLIVGTSIKTIEPIVMHLTGGSQPALKDNIAFAADKLSQFRDKPMYYGWFNAKTFFGTLSQIPTQENPEAPSPLPQLPRQALLNASGLTGLKSVSFAFREASDGARLNIFVSAPESARSGFFKIFSIVSKDANPPTFVPADAIKFSRWRIDGKKSWAELEKTLGAISPSILSYVNSAIDVANATAQMRDPSFDLRKNLIGNLGDDFMSYEKTSKDPNAVPSLFLFSSENPEQTILSVKTVASLVNGQAAPEPRDFLGRKIYTIPLPARPAPGAKASFRSIYCSTGGGYVAISSDSAMVEEFLRSSQSKAKPLRETAGFAEAAQQVGGGGNGWFGYENARETWRAVVKTKKNSPSLDKNAMTIVNRLPFGSLGNGLFNWTDFSLLPDYDKISKYFYISIYSGSMTAEGYTFKMFAPRPPTLN